MNDKKQLDALGDEIAWQQAPMCMAKQIEQLQAQLADAKAEARKYKLAGLGMAASMGEHVCVQEGWQPIETAPKDGTWFLVIDPDSSYCWQPYSFCAWNEGNHSNPKGFWCDEDASEELFPTVWMPLPAAPKPEGGDT